MTRKSRNLVQWHVGADPLINALMRSEDGVLSAVEGPRGAIVANCDQLFTACKDASEWLAQHPCPDPAYGEQLSLLIRSCGGIWSIMSTGSAEAESQQRLLDQINVSSRSRANLISG
jgi:hypothetical protein